MLASIGKIPQYDVRNRVCVNVMWQKVFDRK
jgi:hypothetical protein